MSSADYLCLHSDKSPDPRFILMGCHFDMFFPGILKSFKVLNPTFFILRVIGTKLI